METDPSQRPSPEGNFWKVGAVNK